MNPTEYLRVQEKILGPWHTATGFGRLIHRLSSESLLWERMPFILVQARQSTNCDLLDAPKTHMLYKRWANYSKILKWSLGLNHNSGTGSNNLCSLFSCLLKSLSVVCGVWTTQSNVYRDSDRQNKEGTLY